MDLETTGFIFTPERVAKAAEFARQGGGRRFWKDLNPQSGQLSLVAGPRGAAYYRRGRDGKRVVSVKLGDATGPVAISLGEARRRCLERQYGGEEKTARRSRGPRRPAAGITVGQAWSGYIEAVRTGAFTMRRRRREPLREKTRKGYESHYQAHLSEYADRDVAWLADHVREQVEVIGTKPAADGKPHPAIANQHLQIVRNLFEYLRRSGRWEGANPCSGDVEKFVIDPRERRLTTDEAARLWAAMQTEPEWRDLFLFLALTGRRLSNGQNLPWSRVDLPSAGRGRKRPDPAGWIHYPSGAMKAKKADTVAITPEIAEILRRRQAAAEPGDKWVWPSFTDRSKPVRNVHHAWSRIRKLAQLPDLKIHELRHAAGTWASEGGATDAQVGSMLSHRDPQSTARYSHHGGQTAVPALGMVGERWKQAAVKASKLKIVKPPRKSRSDAGKARGPRQPR